jgi:hypothetical protein
MKNVAGRVEAKQSNTAQFMHQLLQALFLCQFMNLYVYHSASPSCLFLYFDVNSSNLKLAKDSLGGGDLCNQSLAVVRFKSSNKEKTTHINILRRSLVLGIANSAILLHNNRPAAVPVTHAGHPAVALAERRVAHEQDPAVLGAAVDLAPGIHDEGIVGGDDDDEVDALGGQLVLVLEVRGDVHGLAAGGESAGDGDKHDLLAGELLGGVVGLREAAGGRAGVGDGGPAVWFVSRGVSWSQ